MTGVREKNNLTKKMFAGNENICEPAAILKTVQPKPSTGN